MDKWALGRRIQLASPSPFLSPGLSLSLSGCHRTCQALMPSNLLPNTHCRLTFKGMTSISTRPALPLSLSLSPSVSQLVRALSFRPSAFLHPSLILCLWMCWGPLLAFVYYLPLICLSFFFFFFGALSVFLSFPFLFIFLFFPAEIKSNAPFQRSLRLAHPPNLLSNSFLSICLRVSVQHLTPPL